MSSTTPHRTLESVKQIAEDIAASVGEAFQVVGVTSSEAHGNYTEVMFRNSAARTRIVVGVARNEPEVELRRQMIDALTSQQLDGI